MTQPTYPLAAFHPFQGMDAWTLLEDRSRRLPTKPFLTWHPFEGAGRDWTYGEFAHEAVSVAAGLRRQGVDRGDRVIVHLDNCPEFALAWFACAAIGAVAVTTNTRSSSEELSYFADDSQAVAAITQVRYANTVAQAAPNLKWLAVLDEASWAALFGDPDEVPTRLVDPGAPMSVQYTSGTTSRPKGVVWTHANALWAARVNAIHERLLSDDCHLITMPLFHTNALAYSLLTTLWTGGRAVLLPKWSTSRFWDISMQHGCTWASLMNLSLRAVLALDPPAKHSYRSFGANSVVREWAEHVNVRWVGWWGMTETVSHPIVSDPWHPTAEGAIGRPAPEYAVQVVEVDGTTPVGRGQTGALLVKGISGLTMFAEYLNQPAATADSYDEQGWFQTGDLVTVHENGDISFADRAKDMLKVGGENVAASEIERVIYEVAGVREVAVVPAPDDKLDQVPVAFVIGSGDDLAQRVTIACRDKLADFKVPSRIEVVTALPRSTISKVNKAVLKQVLVDGTPLRSAEAVWMEGTRSDPSGDAG